MTQSQVAKVVILKSLPVYADSSTRVLKQINSNASCLNLTKFLGDSLVELKTGVFLIIKTKKSME